MRFLVCLMIAAITMSCAGSKEVTIENVNQIDFQIVSAEYSNWLGGVPNVQGISISIIMEQPDLEVDSLFFRNQKALPKLKKLDNGKLQISANFQIPSKADKSLYKDASQEYGNTVPIMTSPKPYGLKPDECLLRYRKKNKIYLVKIALEKGETKFYQ